jgi:hypothetical protein
MMMKTGGGVTAQYATMSTALPAFDVHCVMMSTAVPAFDVYYVMMSTAVPAFDVHYVMMSTAVPAFDVHYVMMSTAVPAFDVHNVTISTAVHACRSCSEETTTADMQRCWLRCVDCVALKRRVAAAILSTG